jgi:hypothetical protein
MALTVFSDGANKVISDDGGEFADFADIESIVSLGRYNSSCPLCARNLMRRLATCLAIKWIAVVSAFAPAADDKRVEPALVARVKSIEGLLSDVKYLAKLVGQADAAEQLDGLIDAWIGEKGLAGSGIDTKRPIILYALAMPGGADSPISLMIPIADEANFLSFLKYHHVNAEQGNDGSYSLDLPGSPAPVFFRLANKCAYVTAMDRGHIDVAKLATPEQLPAADANGVLGVTLRFDRIPDDLKQMALGQMEIRLVEIKDRKNPDETPDQARIRRQGIDMLGVIIKTVLSEGKSLDFQWSIDRAKDDIAMALTLDGKPNTLMASTIEMLAGGKSRFAPASDSAFHAGVNLAIPDAIRVLVNPFLEMGMKDAVATESDPTKKAMMSKAIAAIGPTIKAGVVDLHIAAGSPKSGGNYNLLAAVGVQGGDKIESTVRELIGQIPAADRAKITSDAAKVNGVSLHQLKIDNLDADAKRLFGTGASAWAGFGKTAIMLGLGGDAAATFAGMTTNDPPKPAPMLVIEGSLAKLASLDKNPSANQVAGQVFGSAPGNDHFRLSLNGGKQLKLDLSFKGLGLAFFQQLNEKKGGD